MHKIPAHTNQHLCSYVVICDMWAQAQYKRLPMLVSRQVAHSHSCPVTVTLKYE